MSSTKPPFEILAKATERAYFDERPICVLMVDDQVFVGETLKAMLKDEAGVEFHFCNDPMEALKVTNRIHPTVILQDLIMPGIDGLTMVKFFRANPATKDVPMIVLSSEEEPKVKSQAFSLGANDYMVKLPDKLEVLARIRYHSQAYVNLLQKNEAYEAFLESQAALKAELAEAERYLISLLPEPFKGEHLKTDWAYTPSTNLGGDAFGYHWIDEDHFSIYLLDVCGHGVGASLLSVSALNVLRTESLAGVDFLDPVAVLSGLNEAFDMEKQNQIYFTLWYDVYNQKTGYLKYGSAGHPPALLIRESTDSVYSLKTPGMVIGAMPDVGFESASMELMAKDRLYVFSDRVYEISAPGTSEMLSIEAFGEALKRPSEEGLSKVASMVKFSQDIQKEASFEDDYSLLEVCFL